jgi:hypothetical protein
VLVARKTVLGRSNVAGLAVVVEACSVQCKAGRLWMEDLEQALGVVLGMGSLAEAYG